MRDGLAESVPAEGDDAFIDDSGISRFERLSRGNCPTNGEIAC
jgi:hypothetical protein